MTEPPEWLESLVDSVADCIEATAPSGSVRRTLTCLGRFLAHNP